MKKIILIKFGGSLISDKTKINKARLNVIENLSKQIKEVIKKEKDLSLIIATGAGGFGHPLAEKYKNNLIKGKFYIRKAVKKLNGIVVSALVRTGLKAVSIKPSDSASYKNGQMVKLLDNRITELLEKNIIPVFHADLIEDEVNGLSILSMDKFLADLAIFLKKKGFRIEKVIFAGTTAGVVSRSGGTIKKITKKDFPQIESVFYKGKGIDVTGGMRYKVEQCLKLAKLNIFSLIINGQKENNLQKIIVDNKIEGTIIPA